jgi:anthranilate phosphoribosyltransferase
MTILQKLQNKQELTENEAQKLMKDIIETNLNDEEIKTILLALNEKTLTPKELASFVKTLKSYAILLNTNIIPLIDTCGTGGDNSNTFNISTTAAFVLAACNVNVAKHGNKSVSSKCGSADLLHELGININLEPKQVKQCIQEIGIGFLFAPNHHPAFKNVAQIRKELGVRTIFNLLGPLLNPSDITGQVIGVYSPELTELYAETLKILKVKNAMIVHGSGLDEITTHLTTKITQLREDKINTYTLNPEEQGINLASLDSLKGNSPKENAEIFTQILSGIKSPKRDIVLLNVAAGLIVANKTTTFKDGIKLAEEAIDSGKAKRKFEDLKVLTNDFK